MNRWLDLGTMTRLSRLAACAGLSLAAGGCISMPTTNAKIDPASPIAAAAAKMEAAHKTFPTFDDMPPAPKDVRAPDAFATAAIDARDAGARLERETADNTWTLTGTERFAANAERQVGADPGPARPEDTEAFARALRDRATPPPPPR